MSGGKKQKVGNRYYYGLHLIPCRKADGVLAIRMGDKVVWEGEQGDGFIDIDQPDAFGGDEREGGFSGRVAVMLGSAAQTVNTYLQGQFDTLTAAYRGIVSLVFQRPYFNANSARLPAIQTKMLNVADIHKGWLEDLAVVEEVRGAERCDICIMALVSDAMLADDRAAWQGAAAAGFIRALKGSVNSVQVILSDSSGIGGSIQFDVSSNQDYEDLAQLVEVDHSKAPLGIGWGPNWWAAIVSHVPDFFAEAAERSRRIGASGSFANVPGFGGQFGGEARRPRRRILVMVSEGVNYQDFVATPEDAAAVLATIPDLEVFCFNTENTDTANAELLDNTPADGVPVIEEDGAATLIASVRNTYLTWVDLNPAHIQRCLLIDPMRGGTATADQIGDSFAEAAQEYFDEGFGLSVTFSGADANLADRIEVDRHCDAVTYLSRATGKWEHRRVREDFDIGDLPVLDGAVVKDWSKLRRQKRRELPNKLTLVHTDRSNGKTASITLPNPVAVRAVGRTIKAQDSRYPFVSNPQLAERLCVRDLGVASEPLLTGDLPLAYLPAAFEISTAAVALVPTPSGGVEPVVIRTMEIRHGAGTDASVWLKVVEQRFDLGTGLPPPIPSTGTIDKGQALPAEVRLVVEAPYKVMVEQVGQDVLDDALTDEPGSGRIMVAAASPSPRHLEAIVGVDAGGDWEEEGRIDFSPRAVTTAPLVAEGDATEVRVAGNATLSRVTVNQLAIIGTEILRIDAMELDGDEVVMTVGRGCLDTAPADHAEGSTILFFGPGDVMETAYLDGESVDVILLPRTGSDELGIGSAPIDTVDFASRAVRPYPPGRLQVNGSFAQGQLTEDVTLTWAHRDRHLQTAPIAEDHTATDIGPEAGTTYTVTVAAEDEAGAVLSVLAEDDVGGAVTYDWDDFTGLPGDTARLAFSVRSVRGGYDSWQQPTMRVALFLAPADGFIEEVP
jgi:hypothetical protein